MGLDGLDASEGPVRPAGGEARRRPGPRRRLEASGQGRGELWDPSTGSWRRADALDKFRTEFALVALQDGRALVIGGRNTTDESFSSAWAFDPDTEHWSKVGLMGTARAAPSVAVLRDGRVLVAGGYFAHEPNWGGRPNR